MLFTIIILSLYGMKKINNAFVCVEYVFVKNLYYWHLANYITFLYTYIEYIASRTYFQPDVLHTVDASTVDMKDASAKEKCANGGA